MRRSLWFAIPILLLCCIPFLNEAVWVGEFVVSLTIDADPKMLEQPFRCITVPEKQLDWATSAPWSDEDQSAVRRISPNQRLVSVACWGRRGLFSDTYDFPEYLIVEYTPLNQPVLSSVRKAFSIPKGRGDRAMKISLPSE